MWGTERCGVGVLPSCPGPALQIKNYHEEKPPRLLFDGVAIFLLQHRVHMSP